MKIIIIIIIIIIINKQIYKKTDLLENLKILNFELLGFNFVMIYMIHIMLLLLKNHQNYIKESMNVF